MNLYVITAYDQGVELYSDIVEEAEVKPITRYYESRGLEVRSEKQTYQERSTAS